MANGLGETSASPFDTALRTIVLVFTLAFSFSLQLFAQDFEQPVTWSASSNNIEGGIYEIILTASMDDTWHVYDLGPYDGGPTPTALKVLGQGIELVGEPYIVGSVHKAYDDIFGMDIGTCGNGVAFVQKVKVVSADEVSVVANIEWQACNEGSCMPPMDEDFNIELGTAGNSGNLDKAADKAEKSIWAVILEAIAWGFVALLTPCVFPMVPMTVSFFLKNSGGKARGRFMASLYGFSIIALYTIPIAVIIFITYFVGGDAVTADIFNWLATHWIPNIIFFAIFMIFAASFFGAFEITMPSWMVNKADAKSDKGGIVGVFFMALTLVLVSFSCTGPIVGSILIKSTQGEIWEPIITMVAFSAAFALPFTVFAFAPSLLKELPKSGGWLNSVKVVLG
ncbi:MAG: thiol:disulfide interchange protein, partial [Bacteroidales bacterium]|nr:thiol:disulfide interchange protein [Bacteroidales bacterium]